MIDSPENPLIGRDELILVAQKCLFDLYDATTSDIKKLRIQRRWYKMLHGFSANIMSDVFGDDYEADRCPSDMERCKDGACMPPGQC